MTQGQTAQFEAKPAEGVTIRSLAWSLPTGQSAAGPAVVFGTKSLPPGLHEVFLRVMDTLGRKSLATAAVSVKRGPPAPASFH